MIKYIKHTLEIDGIEVFPIIAFLIFFSVFMTFLFRAVRMDKKTEEHLKNLPLDTPTPAKKIQQANHKDRS